MFMAFLCFVFSSAGTDLVMHPSSVLRFTVSEVNSMMICAHTSHHQWTEGRNAKVTSPKVEKPQVQYKDRGKQYPHHLGHFNYRGGWRGKILHTYEHTSHFEQAVLHVQ
jgi:hypothetical protein